MNETFAASEEGLRDAQEDAFATSERCLVVCDGMGGHPGGAEAAQVAARAVVEELVESDDVESAIAFACREIERVGGGGTTLVVVLLGEARAQIAWVGDSRAYLVRDAEARRLTEDHSGAEGGLTRWLPDEPTADIVEIVLEPGDHLVLCTDGVSNELDEETIASLVDADDPAEYLVELALDSGASDNCTAIVARI